MDKQKLQSRKFKSLEKDDDIFEAGKWWKYLSPTELHHAFLHRINDVELLIAATTAWDNLDVTPEMCESVITKLQLKDQELYEAMDNMDVSLAFKESQIDNLNGEWLVKAITEWFND